MFSLHWFNPFTRLFRRELDRVCELSCDEHLLRRMDRDGRQNYGETLLDLAAGRSLSPRVIATSFATEKRNLKERLDQIMTYKKKGRAALALTLAAILLLMLAAQPFSASANEMDAELMERWLAQFCQALPSVPMLGDPQQTADPVRPGEYLLEYEFGTVTATAASEIEPEDVIRIDVRTQQVTDCLGMRVGMPL